MDLLLSLLLAGAGCFIILQARDQQLLRRALTLRDKLIAAHQEKAKALEQEVDAYKKWVDALEQQTRTQREMIEMHNEFLKKLQNMRSDNEQAN